MPGARPDHASTGQVAVDISNAVVGLLAEYTGRGPTKAKTYMNEDLITVVMRDTLTKGERSLCRDGDVETVMRIRAAYQRTMSGDLIAAVERLSGRSVIAFLSANHIDPDAAVESFMLAPRESGEEDEYSLVSDGAGRHDGG